MDIKIPKKTNIVSSPLLNVDFSFADSLENRLNGFFGLYGAFQKQIDNSFMTAMIPYVPFDNDVLRSSMTRDTVIGSGIITLNQVYARYLYYGLLMVDSKTGSAWSPLGGTKVLTDTPIQFHGGAKTGSHWDKRMFAEKGESLQADWQKYVEQNF